MNPQKIFSIAEANQLLPTIERLLNNVQQKQEQYAQRHDILFMHELITHAEMKNPASQVNHPDLDREISELEEAVADLEKDLDKIRELGCVVRSIENGLIDFLGELKGKKVYFCWKRGEKSIQYYRDLDGDCKERHLMSA